MVRCLFAPCVAAIVTSAMLMAPSHALRAQSVDPTKFPLVSADDVKYIGSFEVDASDGTDTKEGWVSWGGQALSVNSAARTLLMSGHAWYRRLCEVAIPDDFERGTRVVQPCSDVAEGRLKQIDDGAETALGGSLVYKGRMIFSAYSTYDADGSQEKSHFVSGINLSQTGDVQGPFRVGKDEGAGFVSGYMGLVPDEWQSLLGGPALTGNCCLSIISRTSSGPALSVFNPDDIGREDPVPATELLGYPLDEALAPGTQKGLLYNDSTIIRGVAFPSGTRSVLFIGRIGEGDFCYGEVTACPDPGSPYKGAHMYPYRHQVWAYDALDLLQVKQGAKRPWEVQPYATWRLTEMNSDGTATVAGAAYDQTTRRLYVTTDFGDYPRVHVYEIAALR
jgi:hypothetical protein